MSSGFEIHTHALREELVDFVQYCVNRYSVSAFAQKFHPFNAILLIGKEFEAIKSLKSPYAMIMLTTEDFSNPVDKQFPSGHPDALYIPVTSENNDTLMQVHFGFRVRKGNTYNKRNLELWRKIGRDFKNDSCAGMRLRSKVDSSLVGIEKGFRYTSGALQAFKSGTSLSLSNPNVFAEPM